MSFAPWEIFRILSGIKRFNMHTATLHFVWMLLVAMTGFDVQGAGPPITCEAGTFTVGEPASITCNFRVPIKSTERPINMARYPSDAPRGAIGTDVLLCRWSAEKRKHDCFVEMANYTFDGILTDHLTVRIPAVNFEQAGLYMCFFVPSEGTDPHPCELRVQDAPESSNTANTHSTPNKDVTGETGASQDVLRIIVPILVIVFIVFSVAVGVVMFLRRRRPRNQASRHPISKTNQSYRPHESAQPMIPKTDQRVEQVLEDFRLPNQTCQEVMKQFDNELSKGLIEVTRTEVDRNMVSTFVSPLPDWTEKGSSLVLDLSNTHLKISLVELTGPKDRIIKSESHTIPGGVKSDTVKQLFSFIADQINNFIEDRNMHGKAVPLVLSISFPCKREGANNGCLAQWTHELNDKGIVFGELHTLLRDSLQERRKKKGVVSFLCDNLRMLEIGAIVNNAVSNLVSVTDKTSNCKIGLIIGTGLNACYVEDWTHVKTDSPGDAKQPELIINTELGALGENGCLDFCRTAYDKELDEYSNNPASQILEKMVSGTYIGELVRLVLKRLTREGLLFTSDSLNCDLSLKDSFGADKVLTIEQDQKESGKTASILDSLGVVTYTNEDIATVQRVCSLVCERAAFFAAASLATLINHINQPEVTVVVDGDMYQKHPRFQDMMYNKTQELVNSGLKFSFLPPPIDRSVGAARIAVASLHLRNTQKSKK